MTTIIVTHEDNEIDEFGFDTTDQVISIGRRSSNDVCIPSLSVSGVHARITIDGDSALIEDNNSTNGTYINGRLISRQLINDNDEIVIGKTRVSVKLNTVSADNSVNEPAPLNAEVDEPNAEIDEPKLSAVADTPINDDAFLDDFDDADDYVGEPSQARNEDHYDERPMSLSEKAKLALGRENSAPRNGLKAVTAGVAVTSASAAANRAFASADSDTAVAELEAPVSKATPATDAKIESVSNDHPLDGLEQPVFDDASDPMSDELAMDDNIDSSVTKHAGAIIEIQNGAKSGQVLPIDKPVTTLGRPGIQIAAIMRKPDGYFLMHIESDDDIDMPTLNRDSIGDEPVKLNSGDKVNVAGIDVEFMLS